GEDWLQSNTHDRRSTLCEKARVVVATSASRWQRQDLGHSLRQRGATVVTGQPTGAYVESVARDTLARFGCRDHKEIVAGILEREHQGQQCVEMTHARGRG